MASIQVECELISVLDRKNEDNQIKKKMFVISYEKYWTITMISILLAARQYDKSMHRGKIKYTLRLEEHSNITIIILWYYVTLLN